MESSSSEKSFAKTSKNYYFSAQIVQTWGPHGPRSKQKNNFFFPEIIKPDPKLPKTFYFNKIPYVLAVLRMFFYDVQCFFAKKCHFQP